MIHILHAGCEENGVLEVVLVAEGPPESLATIYDSWINDRVTNLLETDSEDPVVQQKNMYDYLNHRYKQVQALKLCDFVEYAENLGYSIHEYQATRVDEILS